MHRNFALFSAVVVSLAIGSQAREPRSEVSAEVLAALDPTQLGRLACRGLDTTGSTLEARLNLAQSLADARGMGAAPMGLYSDVSKTDLPLGEIDPMARRYFEQGLALAYGFNHKAAIRSFRQASAIDPDCVLCWWGEAMANGPNINAGMDSEQNQAALAALEQASALAKGKGAAIGALVEAQQARYSADPNADRAALDAAYADAMMAIARANPESNDLAILAAEAAMNTTPWDYWDLETGEARPRIAEAVSLIEGVMKDNPAHPQASHLYIHLLELPQPKRAEAAADRLRDTGPKALGHLVHMPSHIYYRIGRYADSIAVNIKAVAADEAYLADVADDGLVRFGYYPHNVHFLLTSAQMLGDVDTVLVQSNKLANVIDAETGRDLPWVQAIYAAPYFAMAQYGDPDEALALSDQPHPLDYVEAMRHYSRAVAHALRRDDAQYAAELAALEAAATSDGALELAAAGFPAPTIIALAVEVAKGRMAMAEERYEAAAAHFSAAAELEKQIPYNEPPFWYYPVSQSLGAAYFRDGKFEEAREAFRTALFDAPNNALALYGLAQTERALGHDLEAEAAEAAFQKMWQGDDMWLNMGRI